MPGTALSSLYGLTTVTKYPGNKSCSPSLWTIFKFESDICSSLFLSFLVYCRSLLRNSPGRGWGMQSGLKKHTKTKSLFVCLLWFTRWKRRQMKRSSDSMASMWDGDKENEACARQQSLGVQRGCLDQELLPGPSLRLHPCLPGPASGDDALARKMPDRFLSTPTFFPSLNWTIAT